MRESSPVPLHRALAPDEGALSPDVLDETVVHDPTGRPWLVATTDRLYRSNGRLPAGDEGALQAPRYETQIFYTARAGIRGFPTGHGQRYHDRREAVAGHRAWCLRVRTGQVAPDAVPDDPLPL
jgi:hypothetical protein